MVTSRRHGPSANGLSKSVLALAVVASLAACAGVPKQQDTQTTRTESTTATAQSPLIPALSSNRIWNGVTLTGDGHTYVAYMQADGPGIQLAEIGSDGLPRAIPDDHWNHWSTGKDVAESFVHVNALRTGPDGMLWAVDAGAPGNGKPAVTGGARLFELDPSTGKIIRFYALSDATRPMSYVNDVRFRGTTAYLTDSGAPGLIVLDLQTGVARRVLDRDPSTVASRPTLANEKVMTDEQGKPVMVNADQLEISPDGAWLYYQPAPGPMSRIDTRALDDAKMSPEDLAQHVQPWINTGSTGGTAMDAQGNLYVADSQHRRILKYTADRQASVLIEDPRLISPDAMWIDNDGYLWIPSTQQSMTPSANNGTMAVQYPVWIYKLQIHAQPNPMDHS